MLSNFNLHYKLLNQLKFLNHTLFHNRRILNQKIDVSINGTKSKLGQKQQIIARKKAKKKSRSKKKYQLLKENQEENNNEDVK